MAHDQKLTSKPPGTRIPAEEIDRLLRNVGIPNEHVLTEWNVRPEDREGQQEISRCIIAAMKNYVALLEKKAEDGMKDEKEGKTDGVASKPYSTEATKEFLEMLEKNERIKQGK